MRTNSGMTLVKIMVAMLLGMLVLAAMVAIRMVSTRAFAEGTADAMLERVVRGSADPFGLREAPFDTVTVPGGHPPCSPAWWTATIRLRSPPATTPNPPST